MVVVSYSGREINAKLVYYGPGLCGKTTNLEYVYDSIPSTHRGKMVSMKTRTERTLFFDFLPVDLGELGGFKTRFLLYTVPGQVYYNATRKLVLRGVDAVVFVADSARGKMNENIESLENLRENLREYGLELGTIPWVLQCNKRDLPDVYTLEEMNKALNPTNVPCFEAVATAGTGVFETLKGVSRLLLEKLSKEIKLAPRANESTGQTAEARPAAPKPAAAVHPPAPAAPVAAASTPAAPPDLSAAKSARPSDSPTGPAPMIAASTATPAVAPVAAKDGPVRPAAATPEVPAPSRETKRVESNGAEGKKPGPRPAETRMGESKRALPEIAAMPEARPSFGERVARFFGRRPAPAESFEPTGLVRPDPPLAVPQRPRTAVVTSGDTTRIARVESAPTMAHGEGLEKRIRIPVTLDLTPEEVQSGATIRLILEIDLAAGLAHVEREARTGTR